MIGQIQAHQQALHQSVVDSRGPRSRAQDPRHLQQPVDDGRHRDRPEARLVSPQRRSVAHKVTRWHLFHRPSSFLCLPTVFLERPTDHSSLLCTFRDSIEGQSDVDLEK